ncbi:MAG: hypothetical protein GPJ21_01265 [Microcystis aeruginosa W13-11]|jgi:6-phosphofructokinase 1|nr:hypothetical protein [Microcystis aeruginosa W13-11]
MNENQHKKIGILTSGGDGPGLNAVIRAVVKASKLKGWDVYGIPYRTEGFMQIAEGKYHPQDLILTHRGHKLPGIEVTPDIANLLHLWQWSYML